MRISVIGTGYLGATHAACLAEMGHEVIGLDVDPLKIESLAVGELPFYEPDLEELIARHVASGRLRFTTSYEEVGPWADVHFIAVGTPQRGGEGAADTSFVEAAISSLARTITRDALIVGKSTVPVGTARRLQDILTREQDPTLEIGLAWNPEFLREGFAVKDTLAPDRIVLGVDADHHAETLTAVYAATVEQDVPVLVTDFETAELIKQAANAFLATKVSFINALSELTEAAGGDIRVLAEGLGLDPRIGRSFLRAGLGFGGGCLPKDVRALQARASELGQERSMRFLSDVEDVNLRRRERAVFLATSMLGELRSKRIAALGAAFKPNSDDVRDSPALDVAVRLFNAGADVAVYDPKANDNAARRFPRLHYVESLDEAVAEADLILVLTEWEEFARLTPRALGSVTTARKIVDARNVLSVREWIAEGWDFAALGRKYEPAFDFSPIGA
ncbi:UDP-glucose/GDP-mannose dehydrogenase family protein [Sinomonas sp. JGH33]|uniref:UDP-glucose 6-dehydrogenase n=1 Tax=Sinomonas terricola TaxID=3110330 RepID=A0ABU5TBL3_9MICC|nr:UDP-glucose/GDP-mannose dehydrogenase family protein [Sinomonas sp. JGH33]MEA5456983.1 UDP-glucose/GDP-mannose dehydrogenase family protein [Sinomonas sp. JGH33]